MKHCKKKKQAVRYFTLLSLTGLIECIVPSGADQKGANRLTSEYKEVNDRACEHICRSVTEGYQPLRLNKSLSDARMSVFPKVGAAGLHVCV